jgi:site-specific DNA-methyltransferase (adenine-specific)
VPIISRLDLYIPPRQRTAIQKGPLGELRDSISSNGLFHAPVVRFAIPPEPGPYVLVIGERRVRATGLLSEAGAVYRHDDKVVMPGELPVTIITHDEAVKYLEAELEENLIREDLPWQDRIAAIAKIHELRRLSNPTQTVTDTARELESRGGLTSVKSLDSLHRAVTEAAIVAPHLSDPTIATARTAGEAFQMVVKKQEARFNAELIRRRQTSPTSGNQSDPLIRVIHGDSAKILPTLGSGSFDLILADPPYGIGADSSGFRSRSAIGGHTYDDSEDTARKLVQLILIEGFRLSKVRANLFMFLDIDLFQWAKSTAQNSGWTVFRTPLSWVKSDSEGMAPWGSSGPRRAVEWIMYATKGQRGLIHSPLDALRYARVSSADRSYGPEKPVDLLQYLIECSTMVGDSIFDPCCGTGSTLEAARRTRRRATGIELDETAYNIALSRAEGLGGAEEAAPPLVAGIYTAPESDL